MRVNKFALTITATFTIALLLAGGIATAVAHGSTSGAT